MVIQSYISSEALPPFSHKGNIYPESSHWGHLLSILHAIRMLTISVHEDCSHRKTPDTKLSQFSDF